MYAVPTPVPVIGGYRRWRRRGLWGLTPTFFLVW